MFRRVSIHAAVLILLGMGSVSRAGTPLDDEWKRVKAADSPVTYARFLEAHPDFKGIVELSKRLAAANRRATASGRQRDLILTWSTTAVSPLLVAAALSYPGTISGAEGPERVLLELVFEEQEGSASSSVLPLIPGVAKEKGKGSWATFLAGPDTATASGKTVERTEPILAIVRGPGRSLPPSEIYVAGSPMLRLVAASPRPAAEPRTGGGDSLESSFAFDEPPVAIKVFTPDYPDEARQGRMEGLVLVEVTVGVTGRVIDAKVVRSDTVPGLEEAAVRSALLSLFRPALQNGVPVEARVVLPFRFKRN